MKQRTLYTEKQPNVRYLKIDNTRADVFVNEFICEESYSADEQTTPQTMFVYWTNIFSVDPTKITELDITNRLAYYLNYEPSKEGTLEDRIKSLEAENQMLTQCLMEMSEIVYA